MLAGPDPGGFPRARASGLRAVGNDDCCAPQMKYLFEETKRKAANTADAPKSSECHMRPNTDYDGFAVKWGSAASRTRGHAASIVPGLAIPEGDCAPRAMWGALASRTSRLFRARRQLEHKQCSSSAARQLGAVPHVNCVGRVSEEYRATHPTAPERVQWISGSVVPHGTEVSNGTWSSRSHAWA